MNDTELPGKELDSFDQRNWFVSPFWFSALEDQLSENVVSDSLGRATWWLPQLPGSVQMAA